MVSNNQLGFSKIKFILVTSVVLIGGYLGWQSFIVHYYFWDIEELVIRQAEKAAVLSDSEIRDAILKRIRENNIPYYPEDDIDNEDFKIERYDESIRIHLEYSEVVSIDLGDSFYYEVKEFPFEVNYETEIGIK